MNAIAKKWLITIILTILGSCLGACAQSGSTSWKEEVLLQNGTKLIVDRSQRFGGRHEIGQAAPIKEEDITFTIPGSSQPTTWTSEYSEDVGRENLKPLALHVLGKEAYIVATPNLCLAYNKWGRPNPPYVVFRYDGNTWKRIALADLPAEFSGINLVINTTSHDAEVARQSMINADTVRRLNSNLTQPYYRTILRKPLKPGESGVGCPDFSSPRYMSPKAPNPISS